MIDPSGFLGVLLTLSEEWRNPSVAVISPLSVITNEPAYQKAVAEGHEVSWVTERNLRRRCREGWKPVTERDGFGRPTIFMDANKEQLLMFRGAPGPRVG
jgi:hypothetical protein